MESLGPVSRKHQDCFDENDKEIQGLIEEKHQKHKPYLRNTSSVSSKTAYSNISKTVHTKLRDMQDPCWAKRLMKFRPFQTKRIWRSSLMHLRQYMVPRAQEPSHSLAQMELVFWLTKKLSWKDGLNTLMVSLIGHYLSMMKLSTDYHRWNVIRCLMSSQPETVKTIKFLSSGKAPGSDAIPAEIYKAGGPSVAEEHYVEKRSHPSRIQGCNNYPPIQKERESSSQWQSSRHLFIVNC